MSRLAFLLVILVVVTLLLVAQTVTTGQMTIKPTGSSTKYVCQTPCGAGPTTD